MEGMLRWTQGLTDKLGKRTMPVVLADLNTGLGAQQDEGGVIRIEPNQHIGDQEPQIEGDIGNMVRSFLEHNELAAVTTFHKT